MRGALRVVVAAMLASFAGGVARAGGGHDRPGPWVGPGGRPRVDRHLLVRVGHSIDLIESENDFAPARTGIAELDDLNARYHVNAVWRLHAEPPRGWRDPALVRALGLDRIYYLQFAKARGDLDVVAQEYASLGSIDLAWVDRIAGSCKVPNDTKYGSQWNLTWEDLDCEPGWDIATHSNVLVAVVDSGSEITHADLDGNLWANPGEIAGNGKDDDGNGYVDDVRGWDFWNADGNPNDDYGHGSHVAGILAAEGNNGRDIAGICWSASVMSVKVLDAFGGGTFASIAQGVVYAADNGAVVANYSLGGQGYDAGLDAAVQYSAGLDVVQVAAAGNLASSVPFYPAALDGVIAVMASDYGEKRAKWSNFGAWCDLCAPGDGITSLWRGNGTAVLTGTSQSSPHVAAIAALVRTLNPQLDRLDTELVIEYSAKDLGTAGRDPTYEWGLADLHRALDMAGSLTLSATSAQVGSTVDLYVRRPDSPFDFYAILPTVSGRTPGLWLGASFPGEQRFVPINYDIVTDLSLLLPTIGVWNGFVGFLDASGRKTATLTIPGGRLLAGKENCFAAIILPASNLSQVTWVTNSITLDVQ